MVEHPARNARLLQHDAVDVALGQAPGQVSDLHLKAQRLGAALHDGNRLREAIGVEHGLAVVGGLVLVGASHHEDRFGDGGGFVQEGSVGDGQAHEVLDHGLEVQQRLEAALGNFRLVRGVRRVPGRGFEDVAADHRRSDSVVIALADHLHGRLVLGRQLAQLGQDLDLAEGVLERQCDILANVIGNRGVYERIDTVVANRLEHDVNVGLAPGADMPVNERSGG
ncbi:hypothetical protein AHiyo1_17660 [Arthrobacter sp. Hiyo1]|nr:hypothetical protein AHiyo1_17660 [Arthrobacter sp. Hiyo1]